MTKITQPQRELLAQAAADPHGAVDAPEDTRISRPLIKQGLAISLPVAGGSSRLVLTEAGRALLTPHGPDEEQMSGEGPPAAPALDELQPAGAAHAHKRPGGKLGELVDLLSRQGGATLEEMMAGTGWLAHSVRGAMAGGLKKKHGLTIVSSKTDGVRVYRITGGALG